MCFVMMPRVGLESSLAVELQFATQVTEGQGRSHLATTPPRGQRGYNLVCGTVVVP